jgi:hypothetical protein
MKIDPTPMGGIYEIPEKGFQSKDNQGMADNPRGNRLPYLSLDDLRRIFHYR